MADALSFLTSSEQIQSNYEKYKDKFKDATAELVNSETFLNLLVAEMTNQDPLEPTSNTEFVTQMAQFTQLTYAQNSSQYAQANYAASLVGKTATASKMDGPELITKTGVVDQVVKNGDSFKVYIGGETFDLDKVQTVSTAVKDETADDKLTGTGNAFGDSIVSASMMIGMSASVSVPQKDGKPIEDTGIVNSIRTKNGEVYLVLESGKEYKLTDVTEVKYPTIQEILPDQPTDDTTGESTTPVTLPDESVAPVTAPDMMDDLEDLSDIEDLNDLADVSGVADVEDIEDEYLEETETEEPVIGDTTAQPAVVDAETYAILEQLLESIDSDLTVEELLKLEAKTK